MFVPVLHTQKKKKLQRGKPTVNPHYVPGIVLGSLSYFSTPNLRGKWKYTHVTSEEPEK